MNVPLTKKIREVINMQVIPNSSVTLYSNIKIRRGMGPIFSSSANRTAYFNQHIVRTNVPTTYIQHENEVRIEVPLSVLKTCNYMSFINPDFENITWYALITDYKYYNNECSVIYFVIDPLMTFMYQFEMHECMISRQHLSITDFNKGELNPYDPSIYQFTTGEEAIVTPEFEKPEYNIQKYYDTPGADGKYMLTSNLVRTSEAYAYDCGEHVMGVIFLAPLSLEKLDEGVDDAWSTSQDGHDFLTNMNQKIDDEFTAHGTSSHMADYSAWNTISSNVITYMNSISQTYNVPQDVVTNITTSLNTKGPGNVQGEYKTDAYMKQLVREGIYSTGDTPSAQWTNLMQSIIDAGGTLFNIDDPYTTQNGTFVGQVPHSSFMRGYNIIAIPSMIKNPGLKLFSDLIEKLTTWESISQIIGIYAINDYVFNTAFVSSVGIIPSPGDIATDNIYTVPTSFSRMGHGQQSVASKKLLTYPYSYLRVHSPDGNVKEYRYEWFKDVTEGTGDCKFKIMGDLNSHPSILMAPIKYRRVSTAYSEDGQDMTDAVNVNLDEMICYDEFAQVPFVTDAYLTYLSNQVMRIHGQNTSDYRDQLTGQKLGGFASFLGNLGGAFNQGAGAAGENTVNTKGGTYRTQGYNAGMTKQGVGLAVGAANAASSLWNTATSVSSAKAQIEEASDYLSGNVHGDIDWGRFNSTKPAHANDIYHPGTNGGIYHYLKGLAVTDFIVTYVQLKPAVLQKLDNYFKLYGYNEAGRSGIPYFYNFIHNTGTDDVKPHWEQDADGDYVTYIQTMDAHITGIPYPFCQYLEGLFNSGYRFINGDALIQ